MNAGAVQAAGMAYSRMLSELAASIANGDLKPDDRLPSEAQFAERYDISVTSVRRAIDCLVASGQVARKQGSGTYVLHPKITNTAAVNTKCDTVAVIRSVEWIIRHPFFSEMLSGLRRGLLANGWKVWDYEAETQEHPGRDVLLRVLDEDAVAAQLASRSDIGAIILGSSLAEKIASKIGDKIPLIAMDNTQACPFVDYNWGEEAVRGIRLLARAGCGHILTSTAASPKLERVIQKYYPELLPKIEFLQLGYSDAGRPSEITEAVYRATMEALKRNPGIDSIFACSDFEAQGALDAVLKCKRSIPDNLRFACLTNRASLLHTAFPVTMLVADGELKGRQLARLAHERIISPQTAPVRIWLQTQIEEQS